MLVNVQNNVSIPQKQLAVKSPNFKAYNIKAIQDGLKMGEVPADIVIKEMKTDLENLSKSKDIDNIMKRFDISKVLSDIGKLKLMQNKAELQFKISLQKTLLATAKPEEKAEIEQCIRSCEKMIEDIDAAIKQ